MTTDDCGKGAIISEGYRYLLWRIWGKSPRLLWVMLNPSTADATHDDPTLASCKRFSKDWGYGGLEVVNLFAYQTPYPSELRTVDDPVGHDNDRYIVEALKRASAIVVAWGAWGFKDISGPRAHAVLSLLKQYTSAQLNCLGITQDGCPCHPARLARTTSLRSYP